MRMVGKELRLECTRCREQQPMLPQLPPVSTLSHSKPRCHANMKRWTRQHALLVKKDFLHLIHPKPNGCLRFDLESCNLMHILYMSYTSSFILRQFAIHTELLLWLVQASAIAVPMH